MRDSGVPRKAFPHYCAVIQLSFLNYNGEKVVINMTCIKEVQIGRTRAGSAEADPMWLSK